MTRKHYVMIAEAIKSAARYDGGPKEMDMDSQKAVKRVAMRLAEVLKKDNAAFDAGRFMKAAGF